jgi:hypothetical protein
MTESTNLEIKIANIILFHRDPVGVERLVKVLSHPCVDCYLHLDKKVRMKPFAHLGDLPNIQFVKRRKVVRWGGFSQLEAIVSSIGDIMESGKQYDFINLLSGQDYPIKPIDQICRILSKHVGHSFMISEPPPTPWWDEATSRYENYHFIDYDFPGKYRFGKMLSRFLPKRKFPLVMQLYGGPEAAYWILGMDAAKYVHSVLKKRDRNWRFFKHTWGADEFLISSLIMNSPFRETVINENYHYIDRSLGGARPKTLTAEDFPLLQASDKFFARKFNRGKDHNILDRIDAEILFAEKRQPAI